MSDENRYTGAITITPPVTAAAVIREAPRTQDARLRIHRAVTPTGQGEVIVLTADAIEPACDGFSGRHLVEDIQRLADHIGPGYTFGGYIQVRWDAGYGDAVPQRYVIRGGQVQTLTPQLVWPGNPRLTDESGNDLGEISVVVRARKFDVPGTDSAPAVKAYNVYVHPPADPADPEVIRGGVVETLTLKRYAFTRDELVEALRRRKPPQPPGGPVTVLEGDAVFESMADAIIAALPDSTADGQP